MATLLIADVGGFASRHLAKELDGDIHKMFGITHAPLVEARSPVYARGSFSRNALTRLLTREQLGAMHRPVVFVTCDEAKNICQATVADTRNLLAAMDLSDCAPRSVRLESIVNACGRVEHEVVNDPVSQVPSSDDVDPAYLWADETYEPIRSCAKLRRSAGILTRNAQRDTLDLIQKRAS